MVTFMKFSIPWFPTFPSIPGQLPGPDKHLGRRGLHLNCNRNIIFAHTKILNAIRSWSGSNDLVFDIYENNFNKAAKI